MVTGLLWRHCEMVCARRLERGLTDSKDGEQGAFELGGGSARMGGRCIMARRPGYVPRRLERGLTDSKDGGQGAFISSWGNVARMDARCQHGSPSHWTVTGVCGVACFGFSSYLPKIAPDAVSNLLV